MTESPQQHEPNQQMTSTTNIDSVPELSIPEQPVLELSVSELTINNQSSTTNTYVLTELQRSCLDAQDSAQ